MRGRNEVIVMALAEAGYPPDAQNESYAHWRAPLPPLDVVEKARGIAYPGEDMESIDPDEWGTVGSFFVDLLPLPPGQNFVTHLGAGLLSGAPA